jgi:phosphoribosylformimino-5-aminoimidazole carboxamide ribonucleotide (ProFAR) isomerase
MSLENNKVATEFLQLCIETGNSEGFLGSLADAKLSPKQIKKMLARMAESEAVSYDCKTLKVAESVRGWESLAGSASFESNRAQNLRSLAKTIREL